MYLSHTWLIKLHWSSGVSLASPFKLHLFSKMYRRNLMLISPQTPARDLFLSYPINCWVMLSAAFGKHQRYKRCIKQLRIYCTIQIVQCKYKLVTRSVYSPFIVCEKIQQWESYMRRWIVASVSAVSAAHQICQYSLQYHTKISRFPDQIGVLQYLD